MLIAISTALAAATIGLTCWIHARRVFGIRLIGSAEEAQDEMISVCIPARNEARRIQACVEAVLRQTYRHLELIVVNDLSTDGTEAVLRNLEPTDRRLRVVSGDELPHGWAGKPHALQQAAGAATGDWLCFVDADTTLAPTALGVCYGEARRLRADLLSIMTRQIMGGFWERAVLPLVMSALSFGFPPDRVNDPTRHDAIANGQFILLRRSVFEAVGGYKQIADRIDEDKALAEVVKWSGYRLVLADGRDLACTRMYGSFAEMWEGWTKNIYLGLRGQRRLVALGILGFIVLSMAALLLPLWPVGGFWWLARGGGVSALVVLAEAGATWTAILLARASVSASMGIPRRYAFTTPLGCGVFSAMMLVSAWNVLSGRGVTWRGRHYHPKALP